MRALLLLLVLGSPLSAAPVCVLDAACSDPIPELEGAGRAVALLRFVREGEARVCSGALIADVDGRPTPYLITARHCIATQEQAESIEAVWDYQSAGCGLEPPSRPLKTWGADLLVASEETDLALLRMHSVPPGRVFLRVEREAPAEGTEVYRLAHVEGGPLAVSSGVVRGDGPMCGAAPRPQFIYSAPRSGAVATGSSGAPLLLPGLRIAGHLAGLCGPVPSDACAPFNDTVDGSLSAAWPLLAPYLEPARSARKRGVRH
jgi:lysyl endopeptidase